jgi:hypothetical protein
LLLFRIALIKSILSNFGTIAQFPLFFFYLFVFSTAFRRRKYKALRNYFLCHPNGENEGNSTKSVLDFICQRQRNNELSNDALLDTWEVLFLNLQAVEYEHGI